MSQTEQVARDLYAVLRRGGLAMACTATGYGLIAMRPEAVKKIYELKGRPASKPCVTVGTLPILDTVADGITPSTRAWIDAADRRWPIAVIARERADARVTVDPEVAAMSRKTGTVALFFGVGPLIRRVAELAFANDELVVGSSANASGTGNQYELANVPRAMVEAVDMLVPGVPAHPDGAALASTMIDLTTGAITRRGVAAAEIEAAWLGATGCRAS